MTPEEYAEKAITMPWGQSPDNLRKMTATLFREAMTEARAQGVDAGRAEEYLRPKAARVERGQTDDTLNAIREKLAKLEERVRDEAKYTQAALEHGVYEDDAIKARPAALEARK